MNIKKLLDTIRKKTINSLGGVTVERCIKENHLCYLSGLRNATSELLDAMKRCYGIPADDWCKEIYGLTLNKKEEYERQIKMNIEDELK